MRFSIAATACAVSVALLAGCSGTGSTSLPGATQSMQQSSRSMKYQAPHGKVSFEKILQLQIAGKMAPQAPVKVLKAILKKVQGGGHQQFRVKPAGGKTAIWATDEVNSYLVGFTKAGKKVASTIDVGANGCFDPTTVKVDHSGNIWNSCEYNSSYQNGEAQEYSSTGSLMASYSAGCPSGVSCTYEYSDSYDQAENSSDVVIGLPYLEYGYECTGSYECGYYGSGFEYLPLDDPSASPTYINAAGYTLTNAPYVDVSDITYVDVDGSNIYFAYEGENETNDSSGYGLGEVENFASSPTIVELLAPGSIEFGGGVWVGGADSFVGVLDQEARTVTKYALPWTGSSEGTYGPTKTNGFGIGDPISGGFNAGDTAYADGDGGGWLDMIALGSGKAKAPPTLNCPDGCYGASFTPSDK